MLKAGFTKRDFNAFKAMAANKASDAEISSALGIRKDNIAAARKSLDKKNPKSPDKKGPESFAK